MIVTDVAGTTRDTVEESVTLGRHLLRLLDTAGIHETDDRIEKLGVERAVEAVRSAELAIFVCDRSRALNDADREAMRAAMDAPHSIAVLNKSDLPAVLQPSDLPFDCVVPVCAKTGEGLDLFEQALDLVFPEARRATAPFSRTSGRPTPSCAPENRSTPRSPRSVRA